MSGTGSLACMGSAIRRGSPKPLAFLGPPQRFKTVATFNRRLSDPGAGPSVDGHDSRSLRCDGLPYAAAIPVRHRNRVDRYNLP